ncbi:MAG: hypothetical protein JF588_20460 [Caulobacterales bacterium]|nr:hypothetical protein [Caulobacterales bacterium]
MRKLAIAALAGLTIAGGLGMATSGSAQPYRYYSPYDHSWHYTHDRDRYDAYRDRDRDDDGYRDRDGAALAGAVLGSLLGSDTGFYDRAPVDRFGPDPNGMIAPDGHRIKCRLRTNWDTYRDAYVTRRVCW